jgi:hypothetical protein
MADGLGFDKSFAGFLFGHDSVAKAGIEVFENKPAGA